MYEFTPKDNIDGSAHADAQTTLDSYEFNSVSQELINAVTQSGQTPIPPSPGGVLTPDTDTYQLLRALTASGFHFLSVSTAFNVAITGIDLVFNAAVNSNKVQGTPDQLAGAIVCFLAPSSGLSSTTRGMKVQWGTGGSYPLRNMEDTNNLRNSDLIPGSLTFIRYSSGSFKVIRMLTGQSGQYVKGFLSVIKDDEKDVLVKTDTGTGIQIGKNILKHSPDFPGLQILAGRDISNVDPGAVKATFYLGGPFQSTPGDVTGAYLSIIGDTAGGGADSLILFASSEYFIAAGISTADGVTEIDNRIVFEKNTSILPQGEYIPHQVGNTSTLEVSSADSLVPSVAIHNNARRSSASKIVVSDNYFQSIKYDMLISLSDPLKLVGIRDDVGGVIVNTLFLNPSNRMGSPSYVDSVTIAGATLIDACGHPSSSTFYVLTDLGLSTFDHSNLVLHTPKGISGDPVLHSILRDYETVDSALLVSYEGYNAGDYPAIVAYSGDIVTLDLTNYGNFLDIYTDIGIFQPSYINYFKFNAVSTLWCIQGSAALGGIKDDKVYARFGIFMGSVDTLGVHGYAPKDVAGVETDADAIYRYNVGYVVGGGTAYANRSNPSNYIAAPANNIWPVAFGNSTYIHCDGVGTFLSSNKLVSGGVSVEIGDGISDAVYVDAIVTKWGLLVAIRKTLGVDVYLIPYDRDIGDEAWSTTGFSSEVAPILVRSLGNEYGVYKFIKKPYLSTPESHQWVAGSALSTRSSYIDPLNPLGAGSFSSLSMEGSRTDITLSSSNAADGVRSGIAVMGDVIGFMHDASSMSELQAKPGMFYRNSVDGLIYFKNFDGVSRVL